MKSSTSDCVWSKTGCFGARNKQSRKNKEINEFLQKEKREYRSTHRFLMLGTPDSGKTTILNKIMFDHIPGPSALEKQQILLDIKKKLHSTTVRVIRAMKHRKPPINLQFTENESHVQYMLNEALMFKEEEDFTDIFFDKCQALWNDDGVRECYDLLNESEAGGHLTFFTCVKYYLEKIESIRDKTYQPAFRDLMRFINIGVTEGKIAHQGVIFHISQINCQNDEAMKWLNCFCDVTAVLFVVDSSGYDVVSENVASPNRLQEAADFFKKMLNNRWLCRVPFILFLNKQDLLEKKIIAGKSRLQDHFPEFKEYSLVNANIPCSDQIPGENPEVTRAKYFIRDNFLRLSQSGDSPHDCYPHFSCGTDSENIERLFTDCQKIVDRAHQRQYELL